MNESAGVAALKVNLVDIEFAYNERISSDDLNSISFYAYKGKYKSLKCFSEEFGVHRAVIEKMISFFNIGNSCDITRYIDTISELNKSIHLNQVDAVFHSLRYLSNETRSQTGDKYFAFKGFYSPREYRLKNGMSRLHGKAYYLYKGNSLYASEIARQHQITYIALHQILKKFDVKNGEDITHILSKTFLYRGDTYTLNHLSAILGLPRKYIKSEISKNLHNFGDDLTPTINNLIILIRAGRYIYSK